MRRLAAGRQDRLNLDVACQNVLVLLAPAYQTIWQEAASGTWTGANHRLQGERVLTVADIPRGVDSTHDQEFFDIQRALRFP